MSLHHQFFQFFIKSAFILFSFLLQIKSDINIFLIALIFREVVLLQNVTDKYNALPFYILKKRRFSEELRNVESHTFLGPRPAFAPFAGEQHQFPPSDQLVGARVPGQYHISSSLLCLSFHPTSGLK